MTLDDDASFAASSVASTDQFGTLLYSATSLDTAKEHHLTVKNVYGSSQGSSMDIDYMVITAGDGNDQYVPTPSSSPNEPARLIECFVS